MKNVKNKIVINNNELEKEIEKEVSEIYPDCIGSEKCDAEINKLYIIKNWAEMLFHGKPKLLKERFLNIISKSEHSKFFEGLNYEYGINNKPKNIKKAFEIYKQQADNSTDILSMYKMYHIYRDEFNNFGFPKRNKILEKYYFFKCYSYLPKYMAERNCLLLNRFNVPFEVKVHIYYEDSNLNKFDKLMNHLAKYISFYKIKKDDLFLIESTILFEFKNNENDKSKALDLLKNLIKEYNLEAIFKSALYISKIGDKAENFFKILEKKNYYRSFCDYALYLFQEKKDYKKSLELLKIASQNGIIRASYLYYDIFLSGIDFLRIEINKEFKDNIIFLFQLLINDISTDGIYSYFEYFFLRKLCIKHWNLKLLVDSKFNSFTKEFISNILENSCSSQNEEEIKSKKELIKEVYQRSEFFCEYNLACGVLYYYGIDDIINIDLKKSLLKFQISYDNSDSITYKRFCYSYISRIKQKLYDLDPKFITSEENEESKKKLFESYYNSINKEYIIHLSASFFYYLAKLYEKKWGNPGNELMEYICLKRASDRSIKNPGNGTIISYYRKYKSINCLEKKGKLYYLRFKEIYDNKDSEGYGDDNSICPICFEYKRNIMALPCKHLFCSICTKKIMEKSECPICRGLIISNFDIGDILNKYNK